jgi:hypothetical protein
LKELLQFYSKIARYFEDQKPEVRMTCLAGVEHLKTNLESSIGKHHMYQTRLEALALSLVHRKHLVSVLVGVMKHTLKSTSCKTSIRFSTPKLADALLMLWRK